MRKNLACFKEKVSLVFPQQFSHKHTHDSGGWSAMDSQHINLDQPDLFKDHYKTHKQMNALSQSTPK